MSALHLWLVLFLLFEIIEPKVLFLRERIIPSRSVELHMWSRALTDRILVC